MDRDEYCKECRAAKDKDARQFPSLNALNNYLNPTLAAQRERLAAQSRINQIIAELKKRGVATDNCPRCAVFDWSVDFLEIAARPATSPAVPLSSLLRMDSSVAATGFIPAVVFVCKNCGYTMFHNINVLETPR